jgi:hypothetical protein
MSTNRTVIYLDEGRAWVAELKEGRARVSSLVAWLTAHPGRSALPSLTLEPLAPSAPRGRATWPGRALGRMAPLMRRLLGGRAAPHPHRDAAVG